MIPGMNSRDMAKAMKRLGIQQVEVDAKEVVMKNKRKALKGKCPACGTGMYRILGK